MSALTAECLAERALLATVLFDPFLFEAAKVLSPEAFGDSYNGTVWQTMHDLNRRRRVISLVTIAEALQASGRPSPPGTSGWAEASAALLDSDFLPEETSVREYLRVILEASVRRRAAGRARP